MKCTFRDDDRHASISSQTWSDFPRLSLPGRTFLTITCATGMVIDQPCKSNNNVPSNVLSVVTFFLFFFFLPRYLWITSLHYQLLKNSNTSTIFYWIQSLWNIVKIFVSCFLYMEILNSIAFCIAEWSKKDLLSKNSIYNYYFLYDAKCLKKRKKDIEEIYVIYTRSYNYRILC